MIRLCERPGCSEPGAVAYGMIPEDLLFWLAPIEHSPLNDPSVLCRRHADAMVVPRGWTLDDRRESQPRLFRPRPAAPAPAEPGSPARRRQRRDDGAEQLQIDGTGEISRPSGQQLPDELPDEVPETAGNAADDTESDDGYQSWQPAFDVHDDLDGLLEVSSPLLARAFRGTDRRRS